MSNAIEIEKVDQAFRTGFWLKKVEVLHQISFSVPEKSVFGLLGDNGAGKTTLIKLIAGVGRPTSGKIRIQNMDVSETRTRAKIGFHPERPYFHEHLTGRQLLKYCGMLSGLNRKRIETRIPEVLKVVHLERGAHLELRKYSKGMLQRIGIAQALIHEPEILILDEPMSGLDPLGRKEMRELIVGLARQGRTIMFSTHIVNDVESICDHVAFIQKGRLIQCGRVDELLAEGDSAVEVILSEITAGEFTKLKIKDCKLIESAKQLKVKISDKSKLNAALSRLLSGGAQIISVVPERTPLEDYFKAE